MQTEDRKKLVEILCKFADIHKRELSELTFQTYWEALEDLPIEKIKENALIHLQQSRFFPMPVDLRGGPKRYDEEDFDDEKGNIC